MSEIKFKKLNKFIYESGIETLSPYSLPVIMKHDIFRAIEKIAVDKGWDGTVFTKVLNDLVMGLAYMYVDMKDGRLIVRDEEIHRG